MKRALIFGTIVAIAIAGFLSIRGVMPFIPILGVSMEPELKAGDLITVSEVSPSAIEVGDVIVFSVPSLTRDAYNYPALVAHRVVKIDSTDRGLYFRTRGDNTSGEDPFTVRARDIKGIVGDRIQYLGFPLLFFQSQQGMIFMVVALVLFAVFLYADELSRGRRTVQRGIFAPVLEESRRSSLILERRIGAQEKEITGTQQALEKFAFAIAEYAEHLKSHTSAIQGLSEASQELKRGAADQNRFLMGLMERMERATGAEEVVPQLEEKKLEVEEKKPGQEEIMRKLELKKIPPGCFMSRHQSTGGEETPKAG